MKIIKSLILLYIFVFSNFVLSQLNCSIDKSNDINLSDQLFKFISNNDIPNVQELIKSGIDLNKKNIFGHTPLIFASLKGYLNIVELLIKAGVLLDLKDMYGNSALIWAVQRNHKEIIKLLIKSGADVNVRDNDRWTAMIWAWHCDDNEIVELAIKFGADVNDRDNFGDSPIIWFCQMGNKDLVELLLDNRADLNFRNVFGYTAFVAASKFGHNEVVDLLNQRVNFYKQQVYRAIKENNRDIFKKYLLKIGSICFRDKEGNNLLHHAMIAANLDLTGLIYSIKPNLICQTNNDGQTPLSYIGASGDFIDLFKKLYFSVNN